MDQEREADQEELSGNRNSEADDLYKDICLKLTLLYNSLLQFQ